MNVIIFLILIFLMFVGVVLIVFFWMFCMCQYGDFEGDSYCIFMVEDVFLIIKFVLKQGMFKFCYLVVVFYIGKWWFFILGCGQ